MPDIRYGTLQFWNGYAYRYCELPLDQQGLVLLRGLNVDDGGYLGAGKTSPCEVFSLLQTGRVGKQRPGERILADDVVNNSVGEGFEARLPFVVDGAPYEIIQHRKHPKFGNAYRLIDIDAGRNVLPGSASRAPQKWVAKEKLSIDDKTFFNLVYLAQDFSNIMLNGTDGERQQSMIQMFGLDAYDQLYKRAGEKLSATRQTVQDIDRLESELRDIKDELSGLSGTPESVDAKLQATKAELLELQQQHDSSLNQMEDLQDLLRQVEQRAQLIQDIKQMWRKVELPVDKPKNVTAELVQQLQQTANTAADRESQLRNAVQLIEQRSILEQRLATLGNCDIEETEATLEKTQTELRRLTNQELPKAEERLEVTEDLRGLQRPSRAATDVQDELDRARSARQSAETAIANSEKALANEVCPTCGQALQDADCDPVELKRQLKQERGRLKQASQRVHDLSAELNNSRQYEELKQQLQRIGATSAPRDIQREIGRLTREEKRLSGLLEAENLRTTLKQQLATLPTESADDLRRQIKKAGQQKDTARQKHTVAAAVWEKLQKIKKLPNGKAASLRSRVASAGQAVREAADSIVDCGDRAARLERLHEKLQSLVSRQQKIEKGLQLTHAARDDIRCLQALQAAFGAKGLKRDRFTAIMRDATENTVPHYTRLLWPRQNAEIRLDDTGGGVRYELHRGGVATGSRLLSGGERNKAGLALLFGMRDLKEKYTGLRTNVLIVDEPFGNLDAYGTDKLISILKDQCSRISTVLVIGNQQEVLDHSAWNQVWWAVREQNEAKLYRRGLPSRYRALAEQYRIQAE